MSEIPNTEQETAEAPQEVVEASESPTEEISEEVETSDEPTEDIVSKEPSDRAKSRQQELANRLKDSEVEKESLRKELEKQKESEATLSVEEEKTPEVPEGAEAPYAQLDVYIEQKATQKVNELLRDRDVEQAHRRSFEQGVSQIESKFKELNPDSDNFDQDLSSTVTQLYLKASKNNPEVKVLDFVQSVMSVRDSGADKALSQVKTETVLQEAASAVTPSSEKVDTTTTEEKLEELLKMGEISAKDAEKYLQ